MPTNWLIVNVLVTIGVAVAAFLVWISSQKRIAADTIGRAQDEARRIIKDAEREADAQSKETVLGAKEKAHEIVTEAERQARQDRQQAQALEQTLTRRDVLLTERQGAIDRLDKDLQIRERAIVDREKRAEAAAAKYESLVAHQQHELERVASLTAEDAKELLLKQI